MAVYGVCGPTDMPSVIRSRHELQSELRKVLGHFATGVTLVSTWHEGRAHAMTANSFTSVSLEPPLVLVSISKQAATCRRIVASGAFAINILANGDEHLARRFAGQHNTMSDPFVDIHYDRGLSGSPVLHHCMAWIDCTLHATHDGGDHTLFLGRVLDFNLYPGKRPLLFYAGIFMSGDEDLPALQH